MPRTNQLCRCSAEPCVHDSGMTRPCVRSWMRSSPTAAAASSASATSWRVSSSMKPVSRALPTQSPRSSRLAAPRAPGHPAGPCRDPRSAGHRSGSGRGGRTRGRGCMPRPTARRARRAATGAGRRTRDRCTRSGRSGSRTAPSRVSRPHIPSASVRRRTASSPARSRATLRSSTSWTLLMTATMRQSSRSLASAPV